MLSDALSASSLSVNIPFSVPSSCFMCCPHMCHPEYYNVILVHRCCQSKRTPNELSLLLTSLHRLATLHNQSLVEMILSLTCCCCFQL